MIPKFAKKYCVSLCRTAQTEDSALDKIIESIKWENVQTDDVEGIAAEVYYYLLRGRGVKISTKELLNIFMRGVNDPDSEVYHVYQRVKESKAQYDSTHPMPETKRERDFLDSLLKEPDARMEGQKGQKGALVGQRDSGTLAAALQKAGLPNNILKALKNIYNVAGRVSIRIVIPAGPAMNVRFAVSAEQVTGTAASPSVNTDMTQYVNQQFAQWTNEFIQKSFDVVDSLTVSWDYRL
jgi:hypothetical protein